MRPVVRFYPENTKKNSVSRLAKTVETLKAPKSSNSSLLRLLSTFSKFHPGHRVQHVIRCCGYRDDVGGPHEMHPLHMSLCRTSRGPNAPGADSRPKSVGYFFSRCASDLTIARTIIYARVWEPYCETIFDNLVRKVI